MHIYNNKYQVKYSEIAKHSEARKELKVNIYAEQSKAGNFLKNNLIFYTRVSKSGIRGELLVATKFFQVSYHFP